jgi:hypothetical protein
VPVVKALVGVVYAVAGLAIYWAATEGHTWATLIVALGFFAACLAATALGVFVGTKQPTACAYLMRASAGAVLVVVAGALAALIVLAVDVISARGGNPPPRTEEIAAAVTAILTGLAGVVTDAGLSITPARLSKLAIQRRYGRTLQQMPAQQPQLDAYYAAQRESFGSQRFGPISGWGARSTKQRLQLIAKA